jgi:hypothetical protein
MTKLICECCGQPIRASRKPARPVFKGYDDFTLAVMAAKNAAVSELGLHWRLMPGASVLATLPAAWVACKVFGRTSKSPRDTRLPAARFWANGLLPVGPEYAAEYAWEKPALQFDHHVAAHIRHAWHGYTAQREAA